jgi:adenylate cyclase
MTMKSESELKNYLKMIKERGIVIINSDQVLIEPQIPKGNKVIDVETSVLFIDIRNSSELSQKLKTTNMTKLYKMFGIISSMAVRENSGIIFQFAGDGFMAAFNSKNDINSRLNAYNSAIRIKNLIEKVYSGVVDKEWFFECGYAIATGHIYMTRLKAKPFKLHSFGIFPGNPTNLSSKLCELAMANQLIVDQSTYEHLKTKEISFQKFEHNGKVVYKCQLS